MKAVKDKRITLNRRTYTAIVEFFQDTPARDSDKPIIQHFDSLHEAQTFLAGFPDDVWDGHDPSEHNYIEIDERRRH